MARISLRLSHASDMEPLPNINTLTNLDIIGTDVRPNRLPNCIIINPESEVVMADRINSEKFHAARSRRKHFRVIMWLKLVESKARSHECKLNNIKGIVRSVGALASHSCSRCCRIYKHFSRTPTK